MYQWLVRFGKGDILMDFLKEYEVARGTIRELTVIISVVFLFQIAIKLWNRCSVSHNPKKVKLIKCDMLNRFNNGIKFLNYIFSSIMLYLAVFTVFGLFIDCFILYLRDVPLTGVIQNNPRLSLLFLQYFPYEILVCGVISILVLMFHLNDETIGESSIWILVIFFAALYAIGWKHR